MASTDAAVQGLHSRFLISVPTSWIGERPWTVFDSEGHARVMDPFYKRVGELLRTPVIYREGEPAPKFLLINDTDAMPQLRNFYEQGEAMQREGADLRETRDWAGKSVEHACRIAGVLATYEGADHISGELMRRAITLTWYYLNEIRRLRGRPAVERKLQDEQPAPVDLTVAPWEFAEA